MELIEKYSVYRTIYDSSKNRNSVSQYFGRQMIDMGPANNAWTHYYLFRNKMKKYIFCYDHIKFKVLYVKRTV